MDNRKLEIFRKAAVKIGMALEPDVRPFFMAAIIPLSGHDRSLWREIADGLGVSTLTDLELAAFSYIHACANDDHDLIRSSRKVLGDAGVVDLVDQAIEAMNSLANHIKEVSADEARKATKH